MMIEFNKVMCISAHPDDIELSMGGSVSRFKEMNIDVYFVINYIPCDFTTASYKERINEVHDSLNVFGIPKENLIINNFRDKSMREKIYDMDNIISSISPDAVFTHYENDVHQDHRDVFNVVYSSCRNKSVSLFMWENNMVGGLLKDTFNPNFFIKLNENNINEKINSWKCHKSQYKKYQCIDEDMKNYSKYLGRLCKTNFVEQFKSIKLFI
tara:strand:+ start:8279 stop:8914 length:636 start_codon:yes stop_codon:yes gene_type:complete